MVRIGVLGDVHGAVDALRRMVARIEAHGIDIVVSLGDLLDRSSPADCLAALRFVRQHRFVARDGRRRPIEMVLGNHELGYVNAALGRPMRFADGSRGIPRPRSKEIAESLTRDEIAWLAARPRFLPVHEAGVLLVHGGLLPKHARVPGWLGREKLDRLTRIGWIDETTGEPLHPSRSSRLHWAHTYRRHHGPRVVFGHVSWPRITRFENAVGIDCSKHGRIAALIVSSEGEAEVELYEETAVSESAPTSPMVWNASPRSTP